MNIENRTSTVCATAALGHAQRGRPVARAREAKVRGAQKSRRA